MKKIYEKIVKLFERYPDVIFGFSNTEFSQYRSLYKCALTFAIPHSKLLKLNEHKENAYEVLIIEASELENEINKQLENILMDYSISYEIPDQGQKSQKELVAPFSLKYSAVHAGIGWIGKNDVLITKEYGPRVRLSAILIDYDFPLNDPIKISKCPDNCLICVKACPHNALTGNKWEINLKREDIINYNLCNEKRGLFNGTLDRKHFCGYCIVSCPIGLK